ncbi:hypothetical protein EJB05_53073 [Eragrostis curvula]|uniref:Legume lectin domain-containing protein n=1 Tax=Eragrostis curvula TaxID=38414 RepID=A0A5J9SR97_9POAL|nr:hypothetical protein EJB05_53073 [Eragrostis curvula]
MAFVLRLLAAPEVKAPAPVAAARQRKSYNSNFNLALLAFAAIASLGITCSGLQFNYPSFDKANKADFSFSPGSGIKDGFLQITPMTGDITDRSGRVSYIRKTLNLWDSRQNASEQILF